MWIIQIADLHLSPLRIGTMNFSTFNESINAEIQTSIPEGETILILLCGDITFQGQKEGYITAEQFFDSLKEKLRAYKLAFFLCPGNHDLDLSTGNGNFLNFDRFSLELSPGKNITFSSIDNNVVLSKFNQVNVVMVNSAHHKKKEYGLANISQLREKLAECTEETIIILLHHHLIPVQEKDESTLRNAYELMLLAIEYNVTAILHGHRHMSHNLKLGTNNIAILGVGSPFFLDTRNINNQINLINIDDDKNLNAFSLRYIRDKTNKGIFGSFDNQRIY